MTATRGLDHAVHRGGELVAIVDDSERNWKQHPWALVAIDESSELAVVTADVSPVVSVLRPR